MRRMATRREYMDYIATCFEALGAEVSYRPMMGEYVLYYRDKVVGGVYDNRLLLKPVDVACELLPEAPRLSPYPGAQALLLVENTDDTALLARLLPAMYPQLPAARKKR